MEVAVGDVPSAAQLRKLRVVDLRKKLQGLELTQSGERLFNMRTCRRAWTTASL